MKALSRSSKPKIDQGNIKFLLIILLYLFLFHGFVVAQQHQVKGPKIGLELSGGGAKGFAHIGAIKVFEEAGLRFDYVGGTSMGSIIGGLYAMEYHPDTMAKMIRKQNWDMLLSDKVTRNYIPIEEKYNADRFILTFPVKGRKVQIKQGMHNGQLINMLLAETTSPYYNITDFQKLPVSFLCIGTDLVTGENVVINKGSLAQAMRASMSIPSYFTPVELEGRLLVDGGVVNNFPVPEVKKMGADIIVGVDVQSGLSDRDELTSLVSILDQITSYYRVNANEKAVAQTDIYIKPDLKDYGMMDYADFEAIMKAGEEAARIALPQLKKLVDSIQNFRTGGYPALTGRPLDSIFITSIQYKGLKKVSANYLQGNLRVKPLTWVKISDLNEGILRAYGSGFFESINYSFLPDLKGANLVVDVHEGGQGILGAGIHYDSDYNVALLLNATFKNVMIKGSKLFIDAGLGENPKTSLYYLVDRGKKPGFGLRYSYLNLDFNQYNDGVVIDVVTINRHKVDAFTQISFKNTAQFKAGLEYEYFKLKSNIEAGNDYTFNSYLTLFMSLNADSFDKSSFPTKGTRTEFIAKYALTPNSDWFTELFDNSMILQLKYTKNFMLNARNVFRTGVSAGATIKSKIPPYQHWFIVGGQNQNNGLDGFIPFTGLRFIEQRGLYMLISHLALQSRVYGPFYLTPKVDLGYVSDKIDHFLVPSKFLAGCGLTVGYDSFIGPVEFTIMGSNSNRKALGYINIGYYF